VPFIILCTEEGKTEEQKQKVSTDITLGISKHFKIPDQAVRIIFQEPKENQISYSGWLKSSHEYKAKKAELQNTKLNMQLTMPLVILTLKKEKQKNNTKKQPKTSQMQYRNISTFQNKQYE
jgi:phenylpyruvate tautomerase PptA (4-oxalocrotonate tautomerase family)